VTDAATIDELARPATRKPRGKPRRLLLDDRSVRALKPAERGQRYEVYDTLVPGLGVRVNDKGAKTYILYAHFPGARGARPARAPLGHGLSLKEARGRAYEWKAALKEGRDPRAELRAQREAAQRERSNTFAAVAEDFIKTRLPGQRKARAVEREIRKYLIPAWGKRPVTEITEDDVAALIERVRDRPAPYVAYGLLAITRSIFKFARRPYKVATSPCAQLKPRDLELRKEARQRVLDDVELVAYWRATERLSYPWRPFYQLLVLTGQRKAEVAGIRRSEVELASALWTIPAERFKSEHVHLVPLGQEALALLRRLPVTRGDCLLSTDGGRKPIGGFSKAKARLDKLMLEELQRLAVERGADPGEVALAPFVQHDVRRTVRTRLSQLGVNSDVAELVIGHQLKGLHAVYDRYQYLDERREALARWESWLREHVGEKREREVSDERLG
jgi:integrase